MEYTTSEFFLKASSSALHDHHRDLYYLVKFLPAYALPAGLPSQTDLTSVEVDPASPIQSAHDVDDADEENGLATLGLTRSETNQLHKRPTVNTSDSPHIKLPDPVTSPTAKSVKSVGSKRASFSIDIVSSRPNNRGFSLDEKKRTVIPAAEEAYLYPASMPPKYTIFDLFPFSLLTGYITKRGHEVGGKKAAKIRQKMKQKTISHNLPLEISLYLVRPNSLLIREYTDSCTELIHCSPAAGEDDGCSNCKYAHVFISSSLAILLMCHHFRCPICCVAGPSG